MNFLIAQLLNFFTIIFLSTILSTVQPQPLLSKSQFDLSNLVCISNLFTSSNNLMDLNYENSHFGMSLQLLHSAGKSWVFVGDPKGNSTDPTYQATRIAAPGVVWRCSLGQNTKDSCQIMHLDPVPNPQRNQCSYSTCQDIPRNEYRDNSWVGGVIESRNNRFVTCGHRRSVGPQNDLDILGICYWFDIGSMYQSWDPNRNDLNIDLTKYSHRLFPLYERSTLGGPPRYFKLPNINGSLVDWSYGQAGISVHITNDKELLIGAPGVRLWTGSIIVYRDGEQGLSMTRLNRNQNELAFGRFSVLKRETQTPGITGRHYDEYFGFAITSGKFYARTTKWLVGGAPKAMNRNTHLTGEVVLFSLPASRAWSFDNEQPIIIQETIKGPQFGSYFGSVLLAADVTNDGLDELFVGAPFYSRDFNSRTKREENNDGRIIFNDESTFHAYSKLGDQGAVFVYTSSGTISSRKLRQFEINGVGTPGGRFGSAIVSIGDINDDLFQDIAVGAPYEDNGQGAVYIFHGHPEITNLKMAERIAARQFNPLFSSSQILLGFGSSISTGNDIDNNGTPDLAIGSALSQQIVVLRSRPIITIQGRLQILGQNKRPVFTVPLNITTMTVSSCVKYEGKSASSLLKLDVQLAIDSRFRFGTISAEGDTQLTSYVTEISKSKWQCETFNAEVVKMIRAPDDPEAHVQPIGIKQAVTYSGQNGKNSKFYHYKIVSSNNQPVLDTSSDGVIDFEQFCPSCPFETRTEETTLNVEIASECADPTNCKPLIQMQSWFTVDEQNVTSTILSWTKVISLHIHAINEAEPAFKPKISIEWISADKKKAIPKNIYLPNDVSCSQGFNEPEKLTCDLGRPLKKDDQGKFFVVNFTLAGMYSTTQIEELNVEIKFYSGNTEQNSLVGLTKTLRLQSQFQVEMISISNSERFGYEDDFIHAFDIKLNGPSIPYMFNWTFKFPTENLIDGNYQEVLLVAPPKGNYHCIEEKSSGHFTNSIRFVKVVKYLDFNQTGGTLSRQRREGTVMGESISAHESEIEESEDVLPPQNIKQQQDTVKKLSCVDSESSETKCLIVRCSITKPTMLNKIEFGLALSPNITKSFIKSASEIVIESYGQVQIFDGTSNDTVSVTKLLRPASGVISEVRETPLWIYIVSGIGGLILLAIITAILYKTGFFKREKKDELEQLKVQAGIQDHLLAANQRVPSFQGSPTDDIIFQ